MIRRIGSFCTICCEDWDSIANGLNGLKHAWNRLTISVLVNGSPMEEFKPKRKLRQGDPLAPFSVPHSCRRACWVSQGS